MKQPKTPEIVELIAKIQERLVSLDHKVEALMMRSLVGGAPAPSYQKPVENQHKAKVMHQVICADCKKECTIPFKPSPDRPVYCKECFSRRRSGNLPSLSQPVKEVVSVPPVVEKKKPATAKKAVTKKKAVAKKTAKRK